MKNIIIYSALSLLLFSCGNNESGTTDGAIASGKLANMTERRSVLQAEIAKLDEAIAKLDTIQETALVSVVKVKDTLFTHYVELQGNVDTKENILIQPEMSGALVSLNVKAGQRVSKGQVLGRIDDAGMSQQVAQLETQLALAKTTFERQKRLWDQKIGSEIQFLQAQTNMQSQQRAVAQAKAQLAKTLIRAPFTGTIDEVFVERGQVVAPGPQGLMRIVNVGNMFVSTSVPETYIGKIKKGSEVLVEITSLGKTYKGKVRQVANVVNPDNRTFSIEVDVPNPDNLLRPNQVAKLKIVDYISKDAIVIPANAIQEDGKGNKFVYVASSPSGNEATAKKALITVGKSSGNDTEVTGLDAGAMVVTEGANTLSDGMKLTF